MPQKLQKLEVEYQTLFDALPQSYILFGVDDPDFTIVAENKSHALIAMVEPGDVVGQPLLKAFPDTSPKYIKTGVSDLLESIRKVIRTGQPDVMDDLRYDLRQPDGKMAELYWRVTHYPIYDKAGKLLYVIQATTNATREIQSQRKLDETQRQLDAALAIGLIGTWLWNLEDDYVVADNNLLHLFGLRPSDAVNGLPLQTFTDAIHPDDRQRVRNIIEKTVEAKSSYEEEYRTVTKDGEVRWVIARGRVECDNDKAVRFPGVIVDITDRKQAEESLRFLSEASTVLSTSLDYRKTLSSIAGLAVPNLADWCGIDMLEAGLIRQVAVAHKDPGKVAWAKELRKAQPIDLNDPTGVPEVLRSGKSGFYPVITDEMLIATSGDDKQLKLARDLNLTSVIIVPLSFRGRTVGAITLVSSDLKRHYTEDDLRMAEELANRASLAISNAELYKTAQDEIEARVILEEQLREANELLEARVQKRTGQLQASNRDLERSNQELQDFAYVASHDLQEPLRKIQAFGNLLEEEFGANLGDGRDYLERMRNAASRMSILIEDLLSFSRVTTKAGPPADVDLGKIAREVVSDLEVRIKETGADVQIDDLPTIKADAMQMRQLLQNLIGNALKFAQAEVPPKIRIYAHTETPSANNPASGKAGTSDKGDKGSNGGTIKYWQLIVEDNGIGFDEKYLDRIFSVFQRLHGKDVYKGTGIGLAICRKIAERHDGTITARSTPGKGSAFIVSFPIGAPAGKLESEAV